MRKNKLQDPGNAWLQWCKEHAGELPLPILRTWAHAGRTEIRFAGAHPNVHFSASHHGIHTSLFWLGEFLGWLHEAEVSPKQDADGGWFCDQCEPDERCTFESLHDLWVDHLFVPWAEHINELFRSDTWVVSGSWQDSHWVEALPARRFYQEFKNGKYTLAFRACMNPQAINPLCHQSNADSGKRIGGFMMLGPATTGIVTASSATSRENKS